jgi:hypothetical protein
MSVRIKKKRLDSVERKLAAGLREAQVRSFRPFTPIILTLEKVEATTLLKYLRETLA